MQDIVRYNDFIHIVHGLCESLYKKGNYEKISFNAGGARAPSQAGGL